MARRRKGCFELGMCKCQCNMPRKEILLLVGLAVLLATGVMLNILACALFRNGWWTFFVVFAYIGAPLPDLLCRGCKASDDDDDDDERGGCRNCCIRGWRDGAYFVTGFLLVSGLALPLVLAHNLVIGLPTMIMSLVGGLCIYAAVASYFAFVHAAGGQEDDDDGIEMY